MIEQKPIKVTLTTKAHEAALETMAKEPQFRVVLYRTLLNDLTARANAETWLGFKLEEAKIREALEKAEKELEASGKQ